MALKKKKKSSLATGTIYQVPVVDSEKTDKTVRVRKW